MMAAARTDGASPVDGGDVQATVGPSGKPILSRTLHLRELGAFEEDGVMRLEQHAERRIAFWARAGCPMVLMLDEAESDGVDFVHLERTIPIGARLRAGQVLELDPRDVRSLDPKVTRPEDRLQVLARLVIAAPLEWLRYASQIHVGDKGDGWIPLIDYAAVRRWLGRKCAVRPRKRG